MKVNRMLVIAAAVFVCVGTVCLISARAATEKTYEIHPDVVVAGHQSDTARLLNAYERLMDRYMNMVEGNIKMMATDVDTMVEKLDLIEKKIDALAVRLDKLEGAETASK